MKKLRALKLFVFVMLGLGAVLFADLGQALGETFLVPQENEMHSRVNEARNAQGLGTLPNDDGLRWMARRQASAMTAKGYIFHNPDLAADADQASLPWVALGENVGKGPSVDAIHRAFLSSASHRSNIMKPDFNALGIGGTADPDAVLYFAQVFAGLQQPAPPPPQEPAPAPAATEPPPSPTEPTAAQTTTEPPPSPTSTTEVQGSDSSVNPGGETTAPPETTSTQDADPSSSTQAPEAEEPREHPGERPGFLELILGLLAKFFGKVAFWR